MKTLLLTSLLAGTFFLGGCVISIDDDREDGYHLSSQSDWEERQEMNRKFISTLEPGVSKMSIVNKLGTADFNEMVSNDGKAVQVLYYRTQRVHDDSMTTKDECTPLVFVNNELVGWGELSVSKYL